MPPRPQKAKATTGDGEYKIETGASTFHFTQDAVDAGRRPMLGILDSDDPFSAATKRYVDRALAGGAPISEHAASTRCGSDCCCCCAGPQGPQGRNGPQGSGGMGPHGAQGPQGAQGHRGCNGPKGDQGEQGCAGHKGCRGFQGYQGPKGNGSQGCQGMGCQGPQGPQGRRGQRGCDGNDGCRGMRGFQGPQGLQGVQGDFGPQGYQGWQGWQGVQGTGPQGVQGWQGVQGVQGVQGFQGPQGFQGWQGIVGFQGVQGNFGPQGFMGPQGVNDTDGEEDIAIASAINFDPLSTLLQITWDLSPTGFLQVGVAGLPLSVSPLGDPTTTSISFPLPPAIVASYDGSQKNGSGGVVATTGTAPRNVGLLNQILCTSNVVTLTFVMQQDMPTFSPGGGTVYSLNVLLQFVPSS